MRDGAGRVKSEAQLDDKSNARIRSVRASKLDAKTEITFFQLSSRVSDETTTSTSLFPRPTFSPNATTKEMRDRAGHLKCVVQLDYKSKERIRSQRTGKL